MPQSRLVQQLKDENESLRRHITFLEKGIEAREEKLLLMLDPVAYNQFKLANRSKFGAIELTEDEKKKVKESEEKRSNDIRELETLGIL